MPSPISRTVGIGIALSLVLALGSGPVSATSVVVPNSLEFGAGNTIQSFPFETSRSLRHQQVYDASEFASITNPMEIIAIAFRITPYRSGSFSGTVPDVQLTLSTTSAASDGLSSTFADNVGDDATVVFDGSLSFFSPNTMPPGEPEPFDLLVTLQAAFLYDPAAGNLLLDVETPSGGTRTSFGFDAEATSGDGVSRAVGDFGSATASYVDTFGLITQFTFVPEPTTAFLVAAGLVALAAAGRRRSLR